MASLATIPNILLIILGFGVLIFIHELGHFVAAKWANIRTEAFAVGMGPVVLAWRKGIGVRFGSTARDVNARVLTQFKSRGLHLDENQTDDARRRQVNLAMDELGIGETEYSLRCLPIGGFVKMLGQEDANPNYVSDDPRSYNMCPVGKRMIVVSAGVIMNLLLAIVLFVVAFTWGVRFQAPVVGDVAPAMSAATTPADNAAALGVTSPGLKPGDVIIETDDDPVATFADIQIASAMSRPDREVRVVASREGVAEPLVFHLKPQKDQSTGLLSFGIAPGASTTLFEAQEDRNEFEDLLREANVYQAGVRPGMRLTMAAGQSISTFAQLTGIVEQSQGQPVATQWTAVDVGGQSVGQPINAQLAVKPRFQTLRYPEKAAQAGSELGLLGLVPLVKVGYLVPGSQNEGILRAGDIVLRLEDIESPRLRDFYTTVQKHKAGPIEMVVLRNGEEVKVTASIKRKGLFNSAGMLNVLPSLAWETTLMAAPMDRLAAENSSSQSSNQNADEQASAASTLRLMGRTSILQVSGKAVSNWSDIRRELRDATAGAFASRSEAVVQLTVKHPTPGQPTETIPWTIPAEDVAALHALGWENPLPSSAFTSLESTLTSGGNPFKAVAMGFHETKKTVLLTYLTIDRLFRGSVGISQLRGPVGIVHIGTKVADRGFLYILFFLGMISVNLAVINFLPMPIVDGGLFLFLVYEKFKGRPPPLAFQNAATIVGICMIGALFLITFYNDVMRLLS